MLSLHALVVLASLVGSSVQQSCAAEYAQCGGQGWTGGTCCQSGYTCVVVNPYYSQCLVSSGSVGGTTTSKTSAAASSTTAHTSQPSSSAHTTEVSGGATTYTTTDTATVMSHSQSAYPSVSADTCGDWTLVDNVCCPLYCATDDTSQTCTCSNCTTPPPQDCMSGTMWGQTAHLSADPDWHYSRSTHFGLTSGGACGFGLYGLCTSAPDSWIQSDVGATCEAFCTSYPSLCQDPTNSTLRGNFAAPNGDYYTQFWPSLEGDLDNYLSCGECYELIMTKTDGTDYAVGEEGYTPPITLEIVDSCPCDANSKWCCGSGADHCGEIEGWTYGCPIPEGSHHMDLSDIAMGRLQGNGSLDQGVIPIRYQRVACPKPGNVYVWLQPGGGPYYFALAAVNAAAMGSVTKIEVQTGGGAWVELVHDPNYTSSRPQERYGSWTVPTGSGPFNLPIAMRLTAPTGEQIVNTEAITSFTPPADADADYWYIDLGVQFTKI